MLVHKVVEHGRVMIFYLGQVQTKVSVVPHERLQFRPVIQLQKSPNAPHEREDVEVFVV